MEPPRLNEVSYFKIKPHVTREQIELKLDERGLLSDGLVKLALDDAEEFHQNDPPRNSGAPVLEEHIYPTARLVLEYQIFENLKGNPKFRQITPEGVIVGLRHEAFDDSLKDKEEFARKYGQEIAEMVLILGGITHHRKGAITYREKTQMKFEALKDAPWPTQAAGLADRVNNTLCLYTTPYLNWRGKPTETIARVINIVKEIALPVADIVSPDFFGNLLRQELNYYKTKYPKVFG